MIPFPFNKNRFSFFVADQLLVGQLCTNPKSDRSLLSCLKVTQCSTSEIGDAPLYNHDLYRSKLWQQDHCLHPQKANPDDSKLEGTAQRIRRPCERLRLWSLVWFQVRATSCHRTSSKSAWKSTPKCTWMGWRVWWSPGAIRWPVADPGCGSRTRWRPKSSNRPRLGFRRSRTTLYPSLTDPLLLRPETAALLRLVIRREHQQHYIPTTSKPAWSPSSCRCLRKMHAPSSGSVSRRRLRLKAATLNWCQLYYIINWFFQ